MQIQLLFCGGTISSRERDGIIIDGNKPEVLDYLISTFPKIAFFPQYLLDKHSENYLLSDICLIINTIRESKHNSILVFCGTDTLAYTSAFLYYGLGGIDKTVVLVSSYLPFGSPNSNAIDNIRIAIKVCVSLDKGIFVAYKNPKGLPKVYSGNSLLSMQNFSNALNAYPHPYAILQDDKLEIIDASMPVQGSTPFNLSHIKPCIIQIPSSLGLDFSYYLSMANLPKAFIIEAYHSSTACIEDVEGYMSSVNTFAAKCAELGTQVYLSGYEDRHSYYLSSVRLSPLIKKMPLPSPALYALLTLQYN